MVVLMRQIWLESKGRLAAVDWNRCSGHKRSFVGGHEEDDFGNFLGVAKALERNPGGEGSFAFVRSGEPTEHFCFNRTRSNHIHPDSEGSSLQCRRLGQSFDRVLARNIE